MKQVSITLGANTLSIECGKVAKQANGSAFVRYGDTVVLATACSTNPREGIDFFPLTVDYREYNYAAGKIPGGFFKREGRPTEKEILTSRLIDRPVRPAVCGWLSGTKPRLSPWCFPPTRKTIPTSSDWLPALRRSTFPTFRFSAPVGAVRVGLVDGKLDHEPHLQRRCKTSLLNLIVAGTEDAIVMVEAGAKEVSEATIIEAIEYAHARDSQNRCRRKRNCSNLLGLKKREFTAPVRDEALVRGSSQQDREGPPRGDGHFQVRRSSKAIARLSSCARR